MNHSLKNENEEIEIRPMTVEESEKYRLLRNREDNLPFFFSALEITEEMQKRWFQKYLSDDKQLMFSVYEKSSELFVGGVSIYDIDHKLGSAEVGRIIIDRYIAAGKRYGVQSISLLNSIAKEKLGLKSLYANIYSSNIASLKSFHGAGYKDVGKESEITKVRIEL